MDGSRFDSLTRALGRRTSRRAVVAGLVGGTVAVAVGVAIPTGEAEARCAAGGARCNRDAACCSGTCTWTTVSRGRRKVRVGACANQLMSAGGPCRGDGDCHSGICYQGACIAGCKQYLTSTPNDLDHGCDTAADCCSGVCSDDGYCKEPNGHPCGWDWNCQTSICDGGACASCRSATASCSTNGECCSGACYAGSCLAAT